MTDYDPLMAMHFNYFDDIRPAKIDSMAEAAMVSKLLHLESHLSLKQAQEIVHDIVHVAMHYTVSAGPAPVAAD